MGRFSIMCSGRIRGRLAEMTVNAWYGVCSGVLAVVFLCFLNTGSVGCVNWPSELHLSAPSCAHRIVALQPSVKARLCGKL